MKIAYMILIFCFTCSIYAQEARQKDIYKNKGFFNITKYTHYRVNSAKLEVVTPSLVVEMSVKGDNSYANSFQTINGYFINPHLSVGIGVGLENFIRPDLKTLPIFLDVRYYLGEEYNSFYAFGDIGFLYKPDDSFEKGCMMGLGFGYKFFVNSKKTIALVSDVGYYFREIKVPLDLASRDPVFTTNGFAFSLGILF